MMSQVMISLISRPTINHDSSVDYHLVGLGIECAKFKNLCIIAMAKAFNNVLWNIILEVFKFYDEATA